MKRLRIALAGAALVVLGVFTFTPGGVVAQAGGATILETGWWSRQPSGTPGNAFEVARAPDDNVSVAAFRIRVDGSVSSALLRLEVNQTVGSPSLQVCATTAPWTPAAPGPWEARPQPTCGATPTRLVFNEAQNAYSADITSFLGAGQATASVMVVPAPDESLTVPPPLPDAPADVPVAPPVQPPPPSTVPAQTPVPLPFTAGFAKVDLQATGGGSALTPTDETAFTPSFEPSGDLATDDGFFATPDIPTPEQQVIAAPTQAEGRFPTRAVSSGDGVDQPWERLPLLVLAAAAIGAATTFGRQRLRHLGWVNAS